MHPIIPNLWFNAAAEEAVNLYVSVFPNSNIGRIMRYDAASAEVSGQPEGSVLTVEFTINGQPFIALNGGPQFTFSEAVSFMITCDTQEEIDHYWNTLSEGGQEGPCGWLKDRFGLSWQVTPNILNEMLADPDPKKAGAAMQAMLGMHKIEIEGLKKAYNSA